jgi:hypothetical protein
VALLRKRDERVDCVDRPIGGLGIARSARGTLGPEPRKHFVAGNGLKPAAFQIVKTAVERFPRDGEVMEEIGHHFLNHLIARAAGLARHLLKLGLEVRRKMNFPKRILSRGNHPTFSAIDFACKKSSK